MYKLLKYDGKEYPVRLSNTVLGEWQERTGKSTVVNLNYKDARILLEEGLKAGHRFAKKEYELTGLDTELMVDDKETFSQFLKMIPEFFPSKKEDDTQNKEGETDEKKQ